MRQDYEQASVEYTSELQTAGKQLLDYLARIPDSELGERLSPKHVRDLLLMAGHTEFAAAYDSYSHFEITRGTISMRPLTIDKHAKFGHYLTRDLLIAEIEKGPDIKDFVDPLRAKLLEQIQKKDSLIRAISHQDLMFFFGGDHWTISDLNQPGEFLVPLNVQDSKYAGYVFTLEDLQQIANGDPNSRMLKVNQSPIAELPRRQPGDYEKEYIASLNVILAANTPETERIARIVMMGCMSDEVCARYIEQTDI